MSDEENDIDIDEDALAEYEQEYIQEKKSRRTRNLFLFFIILPLALLCLYAYMNKGHLEKHIPPQLLNNLYVAKAVFYLNVLTEDPEGFVDLFKVKKKEEPKKEVPAEPVAKTDDKELTGEFDFGDDPEKETPKKDTVKKKEPVKKAKPAPKPAVKKAKPVTGKIVDIRIGLYAKKDSVQTVMKQLEKLGFNPVMKPAKVSLKRYRVLAGRYPFRELAMDAAKDFINRGYSARVQIVEAGVYSLDMGHYVYREDADKMAKEVEDKGLETKIDNRYIKTPGTAVYLKSVKSGAELDKITKVLKAEKIRYVLISR